MSESLCRVGVVAVIRDGDDRRLYERRTDGTWGLLAGGKRADEDVIGAACREVREEVAATFRPERIVGVIDHRNVHDDDTAWTVVGVAGRLDGTPRNAEPDKRDRLAWRDEPPSPLHPTTERLLAVVGDDRLHPRL